MSLRIGVVGYGKLGRIHADNVDANPRAQLAAVFDTGPEARGIATARFPDSIVLDDLERLLDLDLDAVVVATPTPLHGAHILAAAEAGLAVFTEKPVGLDLASTDAVLSRVVELGVPFQIAFQRRWDRRFLRAKELIAAGAIGEPVMFKSHGRDPDASNPANWGLDRNGGLFLNAAIHDYDAARFLLGREVRAVGATGTTLVHHGLAEVGDLDVCATSLFFEGNALALTEWSRFACYGYDIALEVHGTEGMLGFGGPRGEDVLVRGASTDRTTVFDVFGDAYRRSVDAFVDALSDGGTPSPGIEDTRIALNLALTARASHGTGGAAIPVPELRALGVAV